MKKLLVSSMAFAFAFSAAAAARAQSAQDPSSHSPSQSSPSQSQSQSSMKTLRGTVSSVDNTAKSFVVKDSNGKEMTVFWDDSTKMAGDLKEGSSVTIQTSEKDGKTVATSVDVQGTKKPY